MKVFPNRSTILLLLLLNLLANLLNADEINDLIKQFSNTHKVEQKVELLSQLAEEYLTINPDSSLLYANQALALSASAELERFSGNIYAIIGDVLVMKDSLHSAEKYYDTALIYFEKFENYFEVAGVLTVLGNINVVLDNTSIALQYYLKALKLSQDHHIDRRLPYLNLNIGVIHYNANNISVAQYYYSLALDGFEKVNDSLNIARVLSSLGTSYRELNDYVLADEYYHRAHLIFSNLNSPADIAESYFNLSVLENKRGLYKNAIEYLQLSLNNISKIDYTFAGPRFNILAAAEVALGENYLMMGELNEAKDHLYIGYKLAENNSLLSIASEAAENLSNLYEELSIFDSSLFYHKIFKEKSELLLNEENIKKLANIDAQNKYEQLLKQEEIKRIEERDKQQRKSLFFIIAIVILFLLAMVLTLFLKLGRNRVARMELQKNNLQKELELRNKELTTNVMTQLKKNELILEISSKLEKTLAAATPENKPIIERVIKELESDNAQDVWKEFEIRFQNVHTDFYHRLVNKFPDLSSNELRLCAFIKLNLNTKEISSITHQSVNSIDVARSRLRQKLGLGKDDNLTAFLTGF